MKNYLVLLLCKVSVIFVHSEGVNVNLSPFHPGEHDSTTFSNIYEFSSDIIELDIFNINDDVGYLVIQVHSFMENITLSELPKQSTHSYVTGTNIGIIWGNTNSKATFYLLRNIKVEATVRILLVINIYDENDPVPGGCNLTFDTINAPYQKVTYTDDVIKVHSQPPSAIGISCDNNPIQVDMFHIFLPEYDNSQETYFDGLSNMITVEKIREKAKAVYSLENGYKYGRLFSNYRGTGEIFGIIATYKNRSAAYVPAVSYGCDLLNWDINCVGPVTILWKILCATLLFFGLFICFFGHRFFRTAIFIICFTFGVFMTYLVLPQEGNFTTKENAMASMCLGTVCGLVGLIMWWKFGIPLLSTSLTFLLAGTLVASTTFYAGLANIYIFTNNINFWIIFFCIITICLMIWTPAAMHGHIFACSFLGSYATVVAMNYYMGGNLQYIILNTYRRITVTNFQYAVIDPPIQKVDILHLLLWILLVLFGWYTQLRSQRNKPPFPPNRRRVQIDTVHETTPLLQPSAPLEYV